MLIFAAPAISGGAVHISLTLSIQCEFADKIIDYQLCLLLAYPRYAFVMEVIDKACRFYLYIQLMR